MPALRPISGGGVGPLRITIADDHAPFRLGLARAVEAAGHVVVGSAASVEQALDQIIRCSPDVAVVDLRMPDGSGRGVLDVVVRDDLGIRILMVSAHDDEAVVMDLRRAGASGFVSKASSRAELVAAIAAVASGRRVFPAANG